MCYSWPFIHSKTGHDLRMRNRVMRVLMVRTQRAGISVASLSVASSSSALLSSALLSGALLSGALLSAALLTTACVHAVTTSLSTDQPPPSYAAATRNEAECVSQTKGANADAYAITLLNYHDSGHQNPIPRLLFMPDIKKITPYKGPAGEATVTMRVNEKGRVVQDSIRIAGIPDNSFATEVRLVASKAIFWPAVREGCAVPGWSLLRYATPFSK